MIQEIYKGFQINELYNEQQKPYYNIAKEFQDDPYYEIWGTDYKAGVRGYDDKAPRITNGFGLSMTTPVGPLEMVWGFPVQSKNYDIEENYQTSGIISIEEEE